MDKKEKLLWRERMMLVAVCVATVALISQWDMVLGAVQRVTGVLSPFLAGAAIAYLLDIPVRFFMRRGVKDRRIAVGLSLTVVTVFLVLAGNHLFPRMVESFYRLVRWTPYYFNKSIHIAEQVLENSGMDPEQILAPALELRQTVLDVSKLTGMVLRQLPALLEGVVRYGVALGGGLVKAFTALASGLYMLMDKERLLRQMEKLCWALLERRQVRHVFRVASTANYMCRGFFEGKCVDSILMASMVAVGMEVLKLPYSGPIAVWVAVTALVPLVGPMMGCVPSAVLLWLDGQEKGIAFVVLFVVLQYLNGRLLAPVLMGEHTDMPGVLVLIALVVGAAVGGFGGMILSVPLMATGIALMRDLLARKNAARHAEDIAQKLEEEG